MFSTDSLANFSSDMTALRITNTIIYVQGNFIDISKRTNIQENTESNITN